MNDIEGFKGYLRETENNICGNHAIALLMHAIENSKLKHDIDTKFIRYS